MHIWRAALLLAMPVMPAAFAAEVIGHMTTAEPVTEARIAQLPKARQGAWLAYLAASRARMAADKAALAGERGRLGDSPIPPSPADGPSGSAGMPLDRPADWYGGAEARHNAATIVSFQTPSGGWGKNVDRSGPPRLPGQHYVPIEDLPANAREDIKTADARWAYVGTIDNGATTSEMRFLARVQAQTSGAEGDAYRESFVKGLGYLLAAQLPSGGWPQVYPLQGGYHDALTYNDDAIVDVIQLLESAAGRAGEYAFVPADLAAWARAAVDKAYAVILATQIVINGKRTAWGQQYDALTLVPVGARNFEPASLSSGESAGLLMLLMRQENPSAQTSAAIHAGVAWLRDRAIPDRIWGPGPDGRQLSVKPGAKPIWARFYDMTTMKPIFGDRDKSIHDDVSEISKERRNGYSWFGSGPQKVLDRYVAWQAKHHGH